MSLLFESSPVLCACNCARSGCRALLLLLAAAVAALLMAAALVYIVWFRLEIGGLFKNGFSLILCVLFAAKTGKYRFSSVCVCLCVRKRSII